MKKYKFIKIVTSIFIMMILLTSCKSLWEMRGDAKTSPPDPDLRVKRNIEEGRGFTIMGALSGKKSSGTFDFASSNELWRATLDTIDFMPLVSANYSGGIIITDWYNDGKSSGQSVKISIRFLTNEVRSDALDIKVFTKNCDTSIDCKITENKGSLVMELKKSILKKATLYAKQTKDKNKKPYVYSDPG